MRKVVIILTILVFFACLFAGIYTANLIPDALQDNFAQSGAAIATPASSFQHNILIIHIDDLQAQSPRLISVWGLIVYFPEPKIIFQPLYPLALEGNSEIANRFSLSAKKVPNGTFLKALAAANQIEWDNYILVDQIAFQALAPVLAFDPGLIEADEYFLGNEQGILNQICIAYAQRGKDLFMGMDWSSIYPDHLKTNLALDDAVQNWHKINPGGTSAHCEVFGE